MSRCTWSDAYVEKNKRIYLGVFPLTPEGEIEAAKMYDRKAIEIQGEYACLNFPVHPIEP